MALAWSLGLIISRGKTVPGHVVQAKDTYVTEMN